MSEVDGWKHVSELFTPKAIYDLGSREAMLEEFRLAKDYFSKLRVLRSFYTRHEVDILREGRERPDRHWLMPYLVDWPSFFTPIENDAWCSIRYRGMVMYPQYPVLNYFVDFGNPTLKIAIEVDGRQFHKKEKDIIRDIELLKSGWKVFRITGSEMWKTNYRTYGDIDTSYGFEAKDAEDLIYWITKTGDGVIEAIWNRYFRGYSDDPAIEDFYPVPYYEKTLADHRLIH